MSNTGRRYLEWDYGSDLGLQYHTQGEAAASLSQLEKMAITSYSKHLGPEEERRESGSHQRPEFGDTGSDLLGEKISKFTDSLMRHRQLQQPRPSVIRARPQTVRATETDARPGTSSRRSPVKSSSLGSLADSGQQPGNSRCSSSVSCHSLTAGPGVAALVSGPSSSSSAGTIVARQDPRQVPGLSDVMRKLSMDILEDSDQDPDLNFAPDTHSTVSTVEDESASNLKSSKYSSSSSPPEKPKVVWNRDPSPEAVSNFQTFSHDNIVDQDKKSFRGYYRRSPSGQSRSSKLRDFDLSQRSSVHSANQRSGERHIDQSEPSSVPTTSDEEAERPKRLVGMSDGDTSTMDSAQAMGADRAKSFEYIPGETFQLQENSSSYEYLPGHLVSDNRPPTVLNNTRPESLAMRPSPAPGRSEDHVDHVDVNPHSLDLLSLELREKSKDLCVKNISQTKHFFKKLKNYIEYLSTPSLTPEDSRVKQELAERIMSLLVNEETRLGAGISSGLTSRELSVRSLALESSEAKKSGETSTRQIQTDSQPPRVASRSRVQKDTDLRTSSRSRTGHETDLSSLSSELKESDNSSRMSDWKMNKTKSELEYQLRHGGLNSTEAVEIVQKLQKKRLEHMKKLKKEMKKLEKIDHMIVGAAVGGKTLPDITDSSVASSVTNVRSEEVSVTADSGPGSSSRVIKATKTVTSKNILTVNSAIRSHSKMSNFNFQERKYGAEKENKTPTPTPDHIVMEEISPIITVTRSPKRNKSPPQRTSSNFGQVYPSDSNTLTDSNVETLNSNATFITKKSPKQKRRSPKKSRNPNKKNAPVAYYLPVDNLSPVRIGTRVLRERNGWMGSGNRNILTSYMASLDTQPLKKPPANTSSDMSQERAEVVGLSLQQALTRRRPGFVRSCERRLEAMRQAREARELRKEKQERWLEELARQSPRSQRLARPSFTPVPIVRVFNHR